jgi:hypothetical protein
MGRGAGGVFVVVAAADLKVEHLAVSFYRRRQAGWLGGGGEHPDEGWMAWKKNKRGPVETSLCFLPLIYRHTLEWSAW